MGFRTAVALGVLWIGALGCGPSHSTNHPDAEASTVQSGPLAGLRKATPQENETLVVKADGSIPVYDEQGNELTMEEMMQRWSSGAIEVDVYVDQDGEPRAMALRPSTEEEKQRRKELEDVAPAADSSPLLGQPAPDFEVTDIDGTKVSLSELRGRVVVLNFWFRQCKPCVAELPELNALVRNNADNDVMFVALSFNDAEEIRQFIVEHPFEYTLVPNAKAIVDRYKVQTYPNHMVIDREGTVSFASEGLHAETLDTLAAEIERLQSAVTHE